MSKPSTASATATDLTQPAGSDALSHQRVKHLLLAGWETLISVAATFLGLIFITFVIGRLMPADPLLAIVGERASEETFNCVREELGLNLPIWRQFFIYA